MFILPVGAVEEHGPHLAVGADNIQVKFEATGASRRVSQALPDWNVVMMPPIDYGQGGANHLGNLPVHPGTYGIRQSTLRSLIADVGADVARNGFKWVFVVNGHGGPAHNIAVNDACDFVSDTFNVTMLHLSGLFRADPAIQAQGEKMRARFFSAADLKSMGMDVHAGPGETSAMLLIRPDLVSPQYKKLPSRAGATLEELRDAATRPGWQGYLSSPAKSTSAYGRAVEEWWINGFSDLMLRAVRGENLRAHPRQPEELPSNLTSLFDKMLGDERAFAAKLDEWLARRKKN